MLLGNEHKITDYPLWQWLHAHTTMLRYMYNASLIPYLVPVLWHIGARGGKAGWGTALQSRKVMGSILMVSLEFFMDIILPATLRPWDQLSL
jgi:hypothetical protein